METNFRSISVETNFFKVPEAERSGSGNPSPLFYFSFVKRSARKVFFDVSFFQQSAQKFIYSYLCTRFSMFLLFPFAIIRLTFQHFIILILPVLSLIIQVIIFSIVAIVKQCDEPSGYCDSASLSFNMLFLMKTLGPHSTSDCTLNTTDCRDPTKLSTYGGQKIRDILLFKPETCPCTPQAHFCTFWVLRIFVQVNSAVH